MAQPAVAAPPPPENEERPRITRLHVLSLVLTLAVSLACASPWLSFFDEDTLRPVEHFPFRWISRATNLPIKLGVFHGFLYVMEFVHDRALFKRHVGARLTTLWWQLLQHERWGQHMQMHVETQLQLLDAFQRRSEVGHGLPVVVGLVLSYAVVAVQNGLTSLAYHSLHEQVMGFGLALAKMAFDYRLGTRLNVAVGSALDHVLRWVGGALMVAAMSFLQEAPLHPTAIGTALFLGGVLVMLLVAGLRRTRLAAAVVAFADL